MTENLILVDNEDKQWGKMEKQKVHELGLLHRAFSIFVFNKQGELLLQKRALNKYHSAGLWTNTCCSHPRYGEDLKEAAKRRLLEEMNIECKLEYQFNFTYKAELGNGLIEHEFDHVYFGESNKLPNPSAEEVADFKYVSMDWLKEDINNNPDQYTSWLKICFEKAEEYFVLTHPLR